MLASLEEFLRAVVDAALPNNVDVDVGPWTASLGDGVYIHARKLELEPLGDDPPEDGPAHLLTIHDWSTDGATIDFEIPPEITGELLDVEAPPGYPAARGDDFFLDDRTLRFYRPPAGADPGVRARIAGEPARGYRRRRPCRISLDISAYDQQLADADAHLRAALHVSLSQLLELPILAAAEVAGVQVWMRVNRVRSAIEAIEREVVPDSNRVRVGARLELCGELDLLVARGAPAPVGIIEQLAGTLRRGELSEEFEVRGAEAPPPSSSARAIEGKPVTYLAGLGAAASSELAALGPPVTTLAELAVLDVDAHAEDLANPTTTLTRKQQAKLVLGFPRPPSMPAAADAESLADLLALELGALAGLIELEIGYAKQLRDELLTLRIMLSSSALQALSLADFR